MYPVLKSIALKTGYLIMKIHRSTLIQSHDTAKELQTLSFIRIVVDNAIIIVLSNTIWPRC